MSRRNILYIAETTSGGSAFSLFNLVRETQKKHGNPLVLFIKENNPHVVENIKKLGIQIISFDRKNLGGSQVHKNKRYYQKGVKTTLGDRIRNRLGGKAADFYFSLKSLYLFIRYQAALIYPIIRIINKYHIHVVHLNNGLKYGQGAIVAAKISGVPVVLHNRMFSTMTGFEKIFIRFVHKFIYISKAVSDHFVRNGIPPEKGIVIYNALDLNDFSMHYDAHEVKKEFGWTEDEKIVCVVGRIARWKGQEYFLKAMAEVCKKHSLLRGLIIGDHSFYEGGKLFYQHLLSLSNTLGLKDKVIFTGFRKDIPRLLSAADVVVHCSIEPEPFGRVVIEGMASGKPVIGTLAGGVPEIIEDNVNGFLVPCKDVKAMAQAIDKILSDRIMAKRMGTAAKQSVAKKFQIQQHASEIQRVYDAVLSGSVSPH